MKDFRLFKRADTGSEMDAAATGYKDRSYYFRFTYRGKTYVRCLETPDAVEAQKRAKARHKEIVSAVTSGAYNRLDATKLRQDCSATLEQLFAAYRTAPCDANGDTRRQNINALKSVAGDAQQVRDLTPSRARDWFKSVTSIVLEKEKAAASQEDLASLKRSANSQWRKAASLFTPKCLAHYQDLNLIRDGEGLQAFVNAGELAQFTRVPKISYNPPSEKLVADTLKDWEALSKTGDRDLFLAIGHELAFGLRIGEMEQARWSWHQVRNDYPALDGRATVKSGSGLIQVRALDPYYSTMKRLAIQAGWWPKGEMPDDLIIAGTATYQSEGIYRAISAWLRAHGWATQKTNHALRAFAGSQIAMRYGIYEAQMWLRHSTVKVTEQNYSHFVQKFKPADVNSLAAKWATNAPAVPVPQQARPERKITLPSVHMDFLPRN